MPVGRTVAIRRRSGNPQLVQGGVPPHRADSPHSHPSRPTAVTTILGHRGGWHGKCGTHRNERHRWLIGPASPFLPGGAGAPTEQLARGRHVQSDLPGSFVLRLGDAAALEHNEAPPGVVVHG